MAANVLLVSRKKDLGERIQKGIPEDEIRLHTATNLAEVQAAFAAGPVELVVLGAGMDIALRLEIIQHVFSVSQSTTVHMKDKESGPEGMVPFVRGLLKGLLKAKAARA